MDGLTAYFATLHQTLPAGAYPGDVVVRQPIERYSATDQRIWRTLYRRQSALMPGRAATAFVEALQALELGEAIPDFRKLSAHLSRTTGWKIVAVNGLCSDRVFFEHLANRRFPVTWWLRAPDQLDYLQEPDLFHDVFGHVPLLMNKTFADYMQAYGEGGLKALRVGGVEALAQLARLYWYTVEFGLIREREGLRLYGAGILSSKGETLYALDSDTPHRLRFDLKRIMRTDYKIDEFQHCYFVIDGFAELFEATRPDFTPLYRELAGTTDIPAETVLDGDELVERAGLPEAKRPGNAH